MIEPVKAQSISSAGRTAGAPVDATALHVPPSGTAGVDAGSGVRSSARTLADLGPPVDAGRVGEIRAAIADGSYALDADALAAALMRAAAEQG